MSRKFKATKPTGNPVASSSRFPETPLTEQGWQETGCGIWRLAAIRPDY